MRWIVAGLAGVLGCRFGGPTGDPNEYVMVMDARADRAAANTPSEAGAVSFGDEGTEAASDGEATDNGPAVLSYGDDGSDAPGDDANADAMPGSVTTEGGACSAAVAVCDPVHNTGCNGLQQCDVDPSQTTTPTGLCVFASPSEGGPCLATIVTESCAAGFTCVSGDCRQLCFCNADCPTGQCCSDTSGPPGFELCRACP